VTHQKQYVRVSIPEMSTVIGFYRHSNLLAIIPSKLLGPIGVAILVLLLPAPGLPTHSPYPVDIIAGRAPQALVVDGRVRLVYELHLTNFAPWPIEITGIDVLGNGANPLASYSREALNKRVVPVEKVLLSVEPTDSTGKSRTVGEGHAVVIFLDLVLEPGVPTPSELLHRFSFSVAGDHGVPIERTVNGPVVAIVQEPPPVLHAPLRGSAWVAFNALAAYDHRRAFNPFDGRIRIAQRFAIDWVRVGPDGCLFHGDRNSNANFYGYGAEVLAVADGRVSDLEDDLPDNVGVTERKSRVITLDNAVGNYVTLDLGHGRFALFAHLQPGSLRVKLGDSVKAGQVLALLGNSGNSDGPHLHFQLTDANSPLGSEGIPYEFETLTQLGVLDGPDVLDTGKAWQPKPSEKPVAHRREFPVDNGVVEFP
jgi:murein DD-endopeptidase